ncbi:hypothetical protein DL93DRAFT_2081167 [Clavulina sp. PMI_390]|nr:hypothetical protein DL93DRAFT_2081167 [Clavulina sp. PMI_390]
MDAEDGLPKITQPGDYTLDTIATGCTVWVTRPLPDKTVETRRAEVLSKRLQEPSDYAPVSDDPADKYEFYVHYVLLNKRLDEWIYGSRIVLTKELEWPKPKPPPSKTAATKTVPKKTVPKKALKKEMSIDRGGSSTPGPSGANIKRKASELGAESQGTPQPHDDDFGEEDAEGENEAMDIDDDVDGDRAIGDVDPQKGPSSGSKEQEIEKLRFSGSMTQNVHEIARVKNLKKIRMGKHEVEPWYFSPYPAEFSAAPCLYICEFCLGYYPSIFMFKRHRTKCHMLHPPGNEIYRHEDISFFEIDGKKQLTWCRNLSLLSKCFLDHKTLYYDVQPFMYYVMCQRDSYGCHTLGYFSKEKESAEGYNLACILTLPQHQRHGYGKTLIEFSYELSKVENKIGSPEKPLSDLGLLSYRAYWAEKILEYLLENEPAEISLDEIAHKTSITQADIQYTLISMQMIRTQRNTHVLCITDAAREQYAKARAKKWRRIDPTGLQWKPPVFTREQLRAWAY